MIVYPPKGLIVALVTPFKEKGEIDWPSLQNLIRHILPFGDGLLIGEALIGEGIYLPHKLRLELALGAIEFVAGQSPLFLYLTGETEEETMANIIAIGQKHASLAEKGLLYFVDMPLWYHSNRKLPQFYEVSLKSSPVPIILANYPLLLTVPSKTWKRKNIRTSILKRLVENEKIVGLINQSDFKRTINYQRAVRGRREFRLYDGDERSFLNQPSSTGVISAGANLLPAAWKEVVSASLNLSEDPGRNFLIWKQSEKLKRLNQAFSSNLPKNLKFALYQQGLITSPRLFRESPDLDFSEFPARTEIVQMLKEILS